MALKPRGDVTRSPKQEYQWPQKWTCPTKIIKRKKNKKKFDVWFGMSIDLADTITFSTPRRQKQQRFQTVDDDNDDVSLVDSGDAPEMPDSPPPYSVEDEAIAPRFRSSQILEEEHISTNSNPLYHLHTHSMIQCCHLNLYYKL